MNNTQPTKEEQLYRLVVIELTRACSTYYGRHCMINKGHACYPSFISHLHWYFPDIHNGKKGFPICIPLDFKPADNFGLRKYY